MWRRQESEVERAGRALPSTQTLGRGGVSKEADDQWRDEDTSWLQGGTAPWWIPEQPEDECTLHLKVSDISASQPN